MEKEAVLNKLKSNGYMITKQRKVMLDVIINNEISSCKEIYYFANKVDPSIGIATVYRMVNLLEKLNLIEHRTLYKI